MRKLRSSSDQGLGTKTERGRKYLRDLKENNILTVNKRLKSKGRKIKNTIDHPVEMDQFLDTIRKLYTDWMKDYEELFKLYQSNVKFCESCEPDLQGQVRKMLISG